MLFHSNLSTPSNALSALSLTTSSPVWTHSERPERGVAWRRVHTTCRPSRDINWHTMTDRPTATTTQATASDKVTSPLDEPLLLLPPGPPPGRRRTLHGRRTHTEASISQKAADDKAWEICSAARDASSATRLSSHGRFNTFIRHSFHLLVSTDHPVQHPGSHRAYYSS